MRYGHEIQDSITLLCPILAKLNTWLDYFLRTSKDADALA